MFTYQGHKRARPVEPAVAPQETVEIKKPSFKAYKSGLNLSTPSTPARRERVEINASLDDKHLMAELLSSVGQNKQVVLKPSDYARLAKMPVSAYLDASPNELSAIWTGLVRLAEVHQTVEWKPRPNWAVTVVDRLFTENQLQAPKSRYTINLDKFHTVEGYRFAADNWITEYRRSRDDQKQLVNGSWIRSMRLLRRELQVYQSFPMIRLTLELVQAVSGEPETGFHSSLLHLDEVVLLLALLMRLNVYHSQIGMRVRANANFTHKNVPQPEDMLYTAKQACPALLLWALTWVETFCVYDQSQRG
ncbi:MAG: hypothetical protein IPO91_07540 [Chloroflexi bacterium]|nr:hypothetical protein [Chloroflexota bacterium]